MTWKFLLLFGLFINLLTLQSCQNQTVAVKSKPSCADTSSIRLEPKDVQDIVLTSTATTYSGLTANNQSKGYKFIGKKGQKISYQTAPNGFCTWLYTSDNQAITDSTLPQDDNYIIQIAAGENSGTFDLRMSLGSDNLSVPVFPPPEALPIPEASPTETPLTSEALPIPEASPTETPLTSEPSPTPDTAANTNELTKDEARNILSQWLEAKKSIFGSNYQKEAGEELTTGQAYERNITAKPGDGESSVDYLKRSGSYYTYELQKIHRISSIQQVSSNQVLVRAIISEYLTLHRANGRSEPEENNRFSSCYLLQKDEDSWKIAKTPLLMKSLCNQVAIEN